MDIPLSISRIMRDIMRISDIKNNKYPEGCTRHSYSEQDKESRGYLYGIFDELKLDVRIDGMGNVRARYSGKDYEAASEIKTAPVMVGSHIDTVTQGGRYDGLMGVICSLECIRAIKEDGLEIKRPVELMIFAEEEGSNFGITMLGSKAMTGKLSVDELKHIGGDTMPSAYELIQKAGYKVDDISETVVKKGDIYAMIELHIEQGGRLESLGKPIGIVQKIAGMETYKVRFTGVSNHAGATLMKDRKDPMLGAAEVILAMNRKAVDEDTGVATVGKITASPGITNAIAKEADVYVDIRDVSEEGIDRLREMLHESSYDAAKRFGLKVDVELLARSEIVDLSSKVTAVIEHAAQHLGLKYQKMNSGAVHDAVMLTDLTEVGMIFVPSVGGISHSPDEFTREKNIYVGCEVLLEAVLELANE